MCFSGFTLLRNCLVQPVLETFGLMYYGYSSVTSEKLIQNTEMGSREGSRESEAEIYKKPHILLKKRNTHSWKQTASSQLFGKKENTYSVHTSTLLSLQLAAATL